MSDYLVKSCLGYEYDLKDALRHNPTIIMAGDDICAVALGRIEQLEAENARYYYALSAIANLEVWPDNLMSDKDIARAVLQENLND